MVEISPLHGDDYLTDADRHEMTSSLRHSPHPACLRGTRVLDLAGARDTHLPKVLAHCSPLVRIGREQFRHSTLMTGSRWNGTFTAPQAVVWTHLWDWGHGGAHDYHGGYIPRLSARHLVLNLTFDPHTTRNSCFIDVMYADTVEDVTVVFHGSSGDVRSLPSHPYFGDLPRPPPRRTLGQLVTALYYSCRVPHTLVNLSAIPASWWAQSRPWDDNGARETLHAALLERQSVDPHPALDVDALLDNFRVVSMGEYHTMVGEEMFELYTS
ncbi:hypothetical protein CcaverHIS641_0113120 [Cutaneotrichosporon cavernicola]|nr:hypothetical protein CcaverHIS641_0113120 [Cutaneotrichosporon cavernicola]